LTIKFTHEQQTIADFQFADCQLKTSQLEVRYKLTDACTVKLALCVSFYLTSRALSLLVKSDNSHYSIFKDQVSLSTKCRNFRAQSRLSSQVSTCLKSAIGNRKSAMFWWR